MPQYTITIKHVGVYILGLFILTIGISLSIFAGLGVSPVSSLAYALTLASNISIGTTTILTNILFIIFQWIISRKFKIREYILQLIIVIMFGFFTDFTFWIVQHFLPEPANLLGATFYLILSLIVVSLGLFLYLNTNLSMMPYDALTHVISVRYRMDFSKAKIICDVVNVLVATVFCLVTMHNFGSIGIGTFIAAYFTGIILGIFMKLFKVKLVTWLQ